MTMIPEGTYNVRVLAGTSIGKDDKEQLRARVNVQFIDGEHAGRRMTYDEQWNAKTAKYVARSLKAVGWKGLTFASVPVDITEGVETTAEVVHLEIKNGKRAGEFFAKVRSLGGQAPLAQASSADLADADALLGDESDIPF